MGMLETAKFLGVFPAGRVSTQRLGGNGPTRGRSLRRPGPAQRTGKRELSALNSVVVQIARPYALALYELAEEAGTLSEIEASLDQVANLIGENADFSNFLRSPVIPGDVKRAALDAIFEKIAPPQMVGNFLRAVAANGRLFAVPSMISQFKALAAKGRGEASAEVISAAPLTKAQHDKLVQTLNEKIGKTVSLTTSVDPDLIGGLVVKVGSKMIDSSLRTKLTAMRIAMKEVG